MSVDLRALNVPPGLASASRPQPGQYALARRARRNGTPRVLGQPISVLIVSDDLAERQRCATQLEGEDGVIVVGEAANEYEALAGVKQRPHVMLLDEALVIEHGGALVSLLRRASRRTRILLLTRGSSSKVVLEAICRGALGYLDTSEDRASLSRAVSALHAGQAWIPRSRVSDLVDCMVQLLPRPRGRRSGH
jgi:DNA-binding NarL/FixJ family response regulator